MSGTDKNKALILRRPAGPSRRMRQEIPATSEPSFETRLSALLRMRVLENLVEGARP